MLCRKFLIKIPGEKHVDSKRDWSIFIRYIGKRSDSIQSKITASAFFLCKWFREKKLVIFLLYFLLKNKYITAPGIENSYWFRQFVGIFDFPTLYSLLTDEASHFLEFKLLLFNLFLFLFKRISQLHHD